jgi:chromosome segregation ATPase
MDHEEGTGIPISQFYEILRNSERSMGKEMKELMKELQETREGFKKYNGLKPMIDTTNTSVDSLQKALTNLTEQVSKMEKVQSACQSRTEANYRMSDRIRNWGGWIIALMSLTLNVFLAVRLFLRG